MEMFKKHVSLTSVQKNHPKKMSGSVNIENCESKTTPMYHHTLFRMAVGQNSRNISAGKCVEKREPSYTDAGNLN